MTEQEECEDEWFVRDELSKSNRETLLRFFRWLLADFIKIKDFNSEECFPNGELTEDALNIIKYCQERVSRVVVFIDCELTDANGVYADRWYREWENGLGGFGQDLPIGDPSTDREAVRAAKWASKAAAHVSRVWWETDGPDGPNLDDAAAEAEESVESAAFAMESIVSKPWKVMADKLIELTEKHKRSI